jgi:large subunit ribosomal protein L13
MIKSTKKDEIKRGWHLIDAKGQVLGRMATRIVPLLTGKNKPCFVRHLDCGDHVVVINAQLITVSGRKETQKKYTSYSGYPGGLKEIPFDRLRERQPEKIIEKAVYNMLPKNKLRDQFMSRLHVFAGAEHRYEDKFKKKEANG